MPTCADAAAAAAAGVRRAEPAAEPGADGGKCPQDPLGRRRCTERQSEEQPEEEEEGRAARPRAQRRRRLGKAARSRRPLRLRSPWSNFGCPAAAVFPNRPGRGVAANLCAFFPPGWEPALREGLSRRLMLPALRLPSLG